MNHGTDEHVIRTRVLNILQPGKDSLVTACMRYFAVEQHSDGVFQGSCSSFLQFPHHWSVFLYCQLNDS